MQMHAKTLHSYYSLDYAATWAMAIIQRPRLGRSVPTNRLAQVTPLDVFDAHSMDKSPRTFIQNGPVRSMFASRIPQATFFLFPLPIADAIAMS